jgi:protocatechuate 3,4-dioxygenase, beta subunit
MHSFHIPLSRRRLLHSLALASAGFTASGAFAEMLTLTPKMTEGPYYPDHLPLDQDNDLIHASDQTTSALGKITNLSGKVLDINGKPMKGALVEIWQADNNGAYLHSKGAAKSPRDPGFQGYGKFETDSTGSWKFRTIKPGLYTGRTRHYHFGVTLAGQERRFCTQLFFAGEPANEKDGILRGIKDETQKASVIREFKPLAGTPELVADWDIVLGLTPGDSEDDHALNAPPERRRDAPRTTAGRGRDFDPADLIRPNLPF